MNWAQFTDPVSHTCLAGAVVASWSLTQEVAGWQVRAGIQWKTFRENSYENFFFQVQSEFFVPSMTKNNFLIDKHYKMIHGPVKTECSFCKLCMCRCSWSGCVIVMIHLLSCSFIYQQCIFFICFISGSSSNTVTQIYSTMRSTNQFVQWENFHFHLVLVCYAMHCDSGKRVKVDLEPCLLACPDQSISDVSCVA